MKEVRSGLHVMEIPCQNTLKPAFIQRLIKVLVAIGTCFWYIAAAAETTNSPESHYA